MVNDPMLQGGASVNPVARVLWMAVAAVALGVALLVTLSVVQGDRAEIGAQAGCVSTPTQTYTEVIANRPGLLSQSVQSAGAIYQDPVYCYNRNATLFAQTKVCGLAGCNWHNKSTVQFPVNSTYSFQTTLQECRTGTHRYRTLLQYAWNDPRPGINGGAHTAISSEPEFTCGQNPPTK